MVVVVCQLTACTHPGYIALRHCYTYVDVLQVWIVLLACPVIRMIQINTRSFLIYTENNEILRMLTFF